MQNSVNLKKIFFTVFKLAAISAITGVICGGIGALFHYLLETVTHLRTHNFYLIYFLPFAGLIIAFLFNVTKSQKGIDTNCVIEGASGDRAIPFKMAPLIFVSTILTHLFGGSAGREGAALQLGGSIGYNLAKPLKLKGKDINLLVMAGMSGVFSALFGTPVTATFFTVELTFAGVINYYALLPCAVSSFVAFIIAKSFGTTPVAFNINIPHTTLPLILKCGAVALLCGILSFVFCKSIHLSKTYLEKYIKNSYLRIFVGGALIVLLTLVLNTADYNGAGMDVITKAIKGNALPYAFILKIIFTAITIGAGFKGGEIVPAFFTGSVFGCAVAPFIGLSPSLGGAIGFVSLFCGAVKCPVASLILAIEVFGGKGILLFGISVILSYIFSGKTSLYQK